MNLPDIRVLWARRHRNKLKLGHLRGNKFIIKLRSAQPGGKIDAQATLEILRKRGVPNYFGPQRFGMRGDSWQIGRAIVKQDVKEAIDVLCGRPGEVDSPAVYKARELYDAGRFDEAWKIWPYNCREERIAVKAMSKTKGSHRRALFALDRSIKRLYVSAYQSWLFNQILAERIRLNALDQVWPGDMAWLHDRGAVFLVEDAAAEQPRAERLEISPSGPLFGSRTTMAQGRAGEMETTLLASQNVTPEHFRNVKGQKVRGARRPLRFPLNDLDFATGKDEYGPYFELRFYLPAGCYATSLLREICKGDVRTIDASGEGIIDEAEVDEQE
jgi:tRNA pseudouridine13 synthase